MATKIMLPSTKRWKSGRPELCLACASLLTTKATKHEVCPNRSVKRLSGCWRHDDHLICVSGDLVHSLSGLVLDWLPFSGWNMRDALAEYHIWFHFMQEESSSHALNQFCNVNQVLQLGVMERFSSKAHTLFRLSYQSRCILFYLGTSFVLVNVCFNGLFKNIKNKIWTVLPVTGNAQITTSEGC